MKKSENLEDKVLHVFVDWARSKKHQVIFEGSQEEIQSVGVIQPSKPEESEMNIQSNSAFGSSDSSKQSEVAIQSVNDFHCLELGTSELLKHLLTCSQSKMLIHVFLESGCPHYLMLQLLEADCKVFIVQGKDVKEYREKNEVEKSDKNDVKLIRQLYYEKPELFKELSTPEQKEIKLQFLMQKYQHCLQDLVRFKNRASASQKEFGELDEIYLEAIEKLKTKKKECLKQIKPLIKEDMQKFVDIKGIGPTLSAQLLCSAHPKNFDSLSKFLNYCGYTANSYYKNPEKGFIKSNFRRHYSQLAHKTGWQLAKSIVRSQAPDGEWYLFYLKLKEDMREQDPDGSKAKIDGKARNRLATFLLKEIWSRFNG